MVKELVQRFDLHFSKVGVKDFKKSFSGQLPLQDYFLSIDHHFQVHTYTLSVSLGFFSYVKIFPFWASGHPLVNDTFIVLYVYSYYL